MPFRWYICPIIGDGNSLATAYRPKVSDTLSGVANVGIHSTWLKGIDGRPSKTWCICVVNAASLTTVDADSTVVDIFEQLTDAAGISKAAVENWLKTHTVGDVPAAARTRIQTRLTNAGIDITGITLSTRLWDVLLRVYRIHDANSPMENLGA